MVVLGVNKEKIMAEISKITSNELTIPLMAEGLLADGTPDLVDRGGRFPYIPYEKEPEGLIRILNQNTGRYELKIDPNFIPYNSPEYLARMQADAAQMAASAPEAASAQALASTSLSSGQSDLFPNLKIDSQFSAPAPAAPTSVLGMFPEVEAMQRALYQQKQNEAMQAQAMQFASLSPMARAQYSLYMGGQQLGGAIGSALGGKDPQLQMIGLQSRILSELDPSDPNQQLRVAQKYAQVAPELAMKIADNARSSLVKIKQASGAARQGITAKVQEAERIASAEGLEGKVFETRVAELLKGTDKLSDKQATGARIAELTRILSPENGGLLLRPSERAAFEAELAFYERQDKQLSLTSDRDAISAELYDNKPFAQITPAQKAIVNKRVEEEGNARAKASAILLPGQPAAPKDWLAFISQISKDPVMDRTSTVISDAPNAIETIRMSTTNDIAAASLPGSLARLTGEGKNMSDRDIARYARTGGLDDRVAQDVVGFFTGRKTTVTKEQAERFATAVYRGALLERKKFIQDQAEQAGYKDTPNYGIAIRQLDDQLAKFKLIKPSEQTRESLPKATTEVDTEKEKRYQQYKKDQLGADK